MGVVSLFICHSRQPTLGDTVLCSDVQLRWWEESKERADLLSYETVTYYA